MQCLHEETYGGLCIRCGADVAHKLDLSSTVRLATINRNMHVSKKVASALESENYAVLVQKRKLSLVLDLDNTLICATQGLLVRPHLQEFLEAMRSRYDMTLYTLGVASHAKSSLATIDPFNIYFRAVVSREALESDSKRLDFLVQDPRVVIIMDDNMQVWPNQLANLAVCIHYQGSSSDTYLAWAISFFQRVHTQFFLMLDHEGKADVREILHQERSRILHNVHLSFAPFPNYPPETDVEQYGEWVLAKLFGATCHPNSKDPEVQFLITQNPSAPEAVAARLRGLTTLHWSWLVTCFAWLERVPHAAFVIAGDPTEGASRSDGVQRDGSSRKPKRPLPRKDADRLPTAQLAAQRHMPQEPPQERDQGLHPPEPPRVESDPASNNGQETKQDSETKQHSPAAAVAPSASFSSSSSSSSASSSSSDEAPSAGGQQSRVKPKITPPKRPRSDPVPAALLLPKSPLATASPPPRSPDVSDGEFGALMAEIEAGVEVVESPPRSPR